MDRSFVEAIAGMANPEIIEKIPGKRIFSDKALQEYGALQPDLVSTQTLSGFVDFLSFFFSGGDWDAKEFFVSIQGPDKVFLSMKHSELWDAPHFARAYAVVNDSLSRFLGSKIEQSRFITGLMSGFSDAGDRASLLSIVGNIVDESSVNTLDDGVSQRVTLRSGVGSKVNGELKSIVNLAPFRTFPEIDQPKSMFFYRIHANPTTISLHEVLDSQWQVKASRSIVEFLKKALSDAKIDISVIG